MLAFVATVSHELYRVAEDDVTTIGRACPSDLQSTIAKCACVTYSQKLI